MFDLFLIRFFMVAVQILLGFSIDMISRVSNTSKFTNYLRSSRTSPAYFPKATFDWIYKGLRLLLLTSYIAIMNRDGMYTSPSVTVDRHGSTSKGKFTRDLDQLRVIFSRIAENSE